MTGIASDKGVKFVVKRLAVSVCAVAAVFGAAQAVAQSNSSQNGVAFRRQADATNRQVRRDTLSLDELFKDPVRVGNAYADATNTGRCIVKLGGDKSGCTAGRTRHQGRALRRAR